MQIDLGKSGQVFCAILDNVGQVGQNPLPKLAKLWNLFLQCWASLGNFGHVWASLGKFGRVWAILGNFGASLRYFGRLWTILGEFGLLWATLADFGMTGF